MQKALEGGGEPTSDGEAPATKKIKVEPGMLIVLGSISLVC